VNWKTMLGIFIAILVGYWLIMTQIPVNGAAPLLTKESNLGSVVDLNVLGVNHMWKTLYDPEGILSTIPAVATTIFGIFLGLILLKKDIEPAKKFRYFIGIGIAALAIGYAWSTIFPLNKALWTSSFVLVTGGWGSLIFAAIYYVADIMGHSDWGKPAIIFGSNAITVYFLSSFISKLFYLIQLDNGKTIHGTLYGMLTSVISTSKLSSLIYAICVIVFYYLSPCSCTGVRSSLRCDPFTRFQFRLKKVLLRYGLFIEVIGGCSNEVAQLPGIGKRTALRLVLHLLKRPKEQTEYLAEALNRFRSEIKLCKNCHNISDKDLCDICSNPKRDPGIICVVEDIRDVMAIENTAQFRGHYHVLGGKISPIEGIGPHNLTISELVSKVKNGSVEEVILAFSSTMEGDTTNFYIYRQLEGTEVRLSTIARGISVGDELEYADEITLGRSIINRVPFENSLKA
jgi:recombination protein RecR